MTDENITDKSDIGYPKISVKMGDVSVSITLDMEIPADALELVNKEWNDEFKSSVEMISLLYSGIVLSGSECYEKSHMILKNGLAKIATEWEMFTIDEMNARNNYGFGHG